MSRFFLPIRLGLLLLAGLCATGTAAGQVPTSYLQVGAGVMPGFGLEVGYLMPQSFYAFDGVVYLHASPRFAGGENDIQVAAAFGAALRPLGIVRTIGNTGYTPYDIDIGLRLGPGLTFFGGNETLADKNKRFSLVFEPFVRVTSDVTLGRTTRRLYVEGGVQRPYLRLGVWLAL